MMDPAGRRRLQSQDVIAALHECGGCGTVADVHAALRRQGYEIPRLAVNWALCHLEQRSGRIIRTAPGTYAIAGMPFAFVEQPPRVRAPKPPPKPTPPPPEPGTLGWCLAQYQVDARLKGHAPCTVRRYGGRMKPLLALGLMPQEITTDHLRALLPGRPSSRRTARAAFRAFFRYFVDQGWITTNPADRLPKIPADPPDRMPLTDREVEALFDAAEERDAAHGYAHPTSRLVLILLLQGLRRKEACGIRWSNIDWEAGRVAIPETKGRKPHAPIPLLPDLRAELERARPYAGSPDEHVFPYTDNMLYRRVKELGRATGIDRLTPHLWRHTWASRYLLAGGDLLALMRLGGWTTMTMPNHYTRQVQSMHALDRGRELDIGGRMLHARTTATEIPAGALDADDDLTAALADPKMHAILAAFIQAMKGGHDAPA
jgi:integrase